MTLDGLAHAADAYWGLSMHCHAHTGMCTLAHLKKLGMIHLLAQVGARGSVVVLRAGRPMCGCVCTYGLCAALWAVDTVVSGIMQLL